MEDKNKSNGYTYFVSYSHSDNKTKVNGFGMGNIILDKPVRSFDDVILLQKSIENFNVKNVIILNYQLLEK